MSSDFQKYAISYIRQKRSSLVPDAPLAHPPRVDVDALLLARLRRGDVAEHLARRRSKVCLIVPTSRMICASFSSG